MDSARSPRELVEQWLVDCQAAGRSDEEIGALRRELERLNDRQLWRFLEWLGERGPGHRQADATGSAPRHAAARGLARIAGFGLPRSGGGSPWSLRPRRTKRWRHGLSA